MRNTRASNRHSTAAQANSLDDDTKEGQHPRKEKAGSSKVSTDKVEVASGPIGESDAQGSAQAATKTPAAKGRNNAAQANLQEDKDLRKRKPQYPDEKSTRTRRRKTADATTMSKASGKKSTPRTTRRPKTEQPASDEVPSKADEIYLLASGCDTFKKKDLAVSTILTLIG